MLLSFEEAENRAWVDESVIHQRRRGADFVEREGVFRRTDGLAHAYWAGLISKRQMSAGRRYERDYAALHRSGRYRSTLWRFLEDIDEQAAIEHAMEPALALRRARAALTQRQRVLCDAVCGEDLMVLDADLPRALDTLFDHYGAELGSKHENLCVYRPPILTDEQKRAQRIREALLRLAQPIEPIVIKPRGPSARAESEEEQEPDLDWEDFLPQKPSRDDRAMQAGWLAKAGVVRANRDMRHLGVQAKAANRVADKGHGKIRKRVRRRGNS